MLPIAAIVAALAVARAPICPRARRAILAVVFSRWAVLLIRSNVQGLNVTRYPPMGCAAPNTCCKLNQQSYKCGETAASCNVCPECCHDAFKDPTACSRCVDKSCGYMDLAQYGCQVGGKGSCCATGQQNASTTLRNCLIIGDSVTSGMSGEVTSMLKDVCQVQKIIGCSVEGDAREGPCWNVSARSPLGERITWDVIQYNEGLHSLWPRVNTTSDLDVWASHLSQFTHMIQQTHPEATLIYATMTPFMPEKFAQDGRPESARSDVEMKNALAVKTVKSAGVTRINDLYSIITQKCGIEYRNCSICDDESKYHGINSTLPCDPPVQCGYHYVAEGWQMLANATQIAIRAALKDKETH